MLVPRFIHGLTSDVKKESLRRIRLFQKGAPWAEAMADELVDVATLPGLIVLDGPSPNLGFEPHTHIYSPFRWVWLSLLTKIDNSTESGMVLYRQTESRIFFDAVRSAWGVLGVLAGAWWVTSAAHHWPYVQAVERHWDEFTAIGDRFSGGSQVPRPLWCISSAPDYAVCALGLSREDLHALMPQGFHALYRRLLEVRAAQGLPPPPGEAP
jgi:hypothetical protein